MGVRKQALGVAGGAGLFTGGVAIGRLLRLDNQRGDYRRAWEDHDLATLAWLDGLASTDTPQDRRPYTIVSLGDSATQGIGASRVQESYPARLAAAIAQALDREVALLNLSMSGATTESVVLTQLPQLRGLDLPGRGTTPDLFTLNIGGNDVMVADMSEEAFTAHAEEIASALPAGSLVGNISSFGVLRTETRAAELSRILGKVAESHGHHVVDLRALSQEFSVAKYTFGYHAADLFHPNSAAYADWAQRFADQWTQANGLPPVLVSEAPEWEMRSARVAQSGA
ncbi:SGNH/GDSL hydrolase family protein [Actinomyces polynesiensis]|uniref:SGNH/GDSL hydrolase family protein n=1 Tax=Actinomyces polynesiensis TaxID=1325934 RepID=UPI0005BAE4D8|nr:SGNH/GDSL hydrolase family protein [Actinomyces polynesiensis]